MITARIGVVSYLNTLPYIRALHGLMDSRHNSLVVDHPAALARQVLGGTLDLGLVPVTVLLESDALQRYSRYGIGCNGAVGSVLLCAQVGLDQIQEVWLDYQSRTSALLVQLLARHYWKVNWEFKHASLGFERQIKRSTAGLLIGDRALRLREHFPHCFDLGQAWKEWTGRPFVFAAWIGKAQSSINWSELLERTFASIAAHARQVASEQQVNFPNVDVYKYLNEQIHYHITEQHEEGLSYFLKWVGTLLPQEIPKL
ncbi:MAG: menaquinone biosynthesis protein [Chitinophagales bacterium]|nr:menaquinone biosynthesis protein [Chitinophagales bacterium]MDW8427662.1 menaquinone biosynthesis protein [Chitinophagales bacterium]